MAGVKHSLDVTAHIETEGVTAENPTSPFLAVFEGFRSELDEHHDRRERVVKASRDITALSKKMIFALQRVRTLGSPIPAAVTKAITPHLSQITTLFTTIAPDLQGPNAWRYQRQISPGIQEYIEAIAFSHYLETQTLLSFPAAQALIPRASTNNNDEGPRVELTEDDYLLGLFDTVGELMRFAITTMATSGSVPAGDGTGRDVVGDLRVLRGLFEALETGGKAGGRGQLAGQVEKKMEVMRTCVEKVEQALYGMIVRGRERPKGWVPELEGGVGRKEVESY